MVERALGGQEIASSIKTNHREGDINLSDVSQMLTNTHARRPGRWGDDMSLANEALHDRGLLPNVDLVGVRGQDFIVRDKVSSRIQIIDSTNVSRQVDLVGGTPQRELGGRQANIAPDGSGTVVAGRDDRFAWVLAKSILQAQGLDNPTPNQIANYQMEIEKINGRKVQTFKTGEEIKIPSITRAGESSGNAPIGGDRSPGRGSLDKSGAVERPAGTAQEEQERRATEFRARMQTQLDTLAQQYAKIAEQARAAALRQSESLVAQQQAEEARRASVEATTRAWFHREGGSTAITPRDRELEAIRRARAFVSERD